MAAVNVPVPGEVSALTEIHPEPLRRLLNILSTPYPNPMMFGVGSSCATPKGGWADTNTIATDTFPPLFIDQATLVEQVKRVKEIEAIESDSFVQQTFRSSKEVKKSVEPSEVKHATAASGPASVVADPPSNEKEIDPSSIPTAIKYQDDNSLAHPNLFIEKADAEEKWFKRLIALRQERLMGSPVA
ncbi:PREDICTED: serine/Arginine-related protein 53-like [Ceratotherium simum simum]|uniref:Serine/Arginine-related protein 53-like n=1 Tax=Ceratotherium simum simum TaxID=73337 RepID=A0ABM1DIT6_CERSS|nr:PREDICTED: serine/Arginine-related protein 53-like [Ceratotherium simum simum]